MLRVEHLSCGYGNKPVLSDISFSVAEGTVLVLLGPNGIGKTTLFKTMLGLLPSLGGRVYLNDHEINLRPGSPDMRQIAYVPQAHTPAFAFTVMEIVLMGRTAQMHAFATPGDEDRAISQQVLDEMGLGHLADRSYTEISGGERQMVLIARALVQEPKVLIMDEPAASLDLGNQAKLLRIVRNLAHNRGMCVVMTSHNPDHALLVADDVLLLSHDGVHYGTADDILNERLLSHVYGATIRILGGGRQGVAAEDTPDGAAGSADAGAGTTALRACTLEL